MCRKLGENSADAVVATLVLCTVQDVAAVVDSCFKVLRPGGIFLFFHHSRDDPVKHPWKVKWQEILTPLTCRLFDGCHVNRDPIGIIQQAGFSSVQFEKYYPKGFMEIASPIH